MIKKGLVLSSCFGLMLTSCTVQTRSDNAAESTFDLLVTPVGDVNFPVECNVEAAPLVERGVALLHHMMYDEASLVFSMADDRDPTCAMAYWGQAMAMIHPLWPDTPSSEEFERGSNFVRLAIELGGYSEREDQYIATAGAYFENAASLTEKNRLARFEAAWKTVMEKNPDDLEARAFYSLALRAKAGAGGKDLSQQEKAGLIAESVLADNPNHPGAHHYIIHSYDFPQLAEKALAVADNYGKIAPRVPHASHMMTHIYTRLGDWDKVIEWNTASADTAWSLCVSTGKINPHYTHALDYLAYAYLQTGQDDAVVELIQTADELQPPYSELSRDASAYAFAAIPARYALERRDWAAAIKLEPRSPSSFPWEERFDRYVAITHFARAIGFARLGSPDDVDAEIGTLQILRARVAEDNPYWALQIDIQIETARGWQTFANGNVEQALAQMKHAASLEKSTNKHPITPGEVLPTTELYGDMLLEAGRYDLAFDAYRASLARGLRRYNSVYGAGKSADGLGDVAAAAGYYSELIKMAGSSNTKRSSVMEAQEFLENH
jgi:hypothetical protein